MPTPELVLTCEHAGNEVPPPYGSLFTRDLQALLTHRAYDIGALELARTLQTETGAPLHYTLISRLLVECNRSTGTQDHFSEFSQVLSPREKEYVISQYYLPYREQVTNALEDAIHETGRVVHVSVHSFTPVLNGETRTADIGLLFDPERSFEVSFCNNLTAALRELAPELIVKDNYPYLGTADGFTKTLRAQFPDSQYAGIELEINQKYPESGNEETWEHLQRVIAKAVKAALLQQ